MRDLSTNFGEAPERYQAFRPDYPPEIFDFLFDHLKSERAHAVDLGAGSGQATRRLTEFFTHVTAVEPDERLVKSGAFPANVEIRIQSAEDANIGESAADAVICATAFHWMDQPLICRKAARWLKPGGVFFPFAFDAFEVEGAASDYYKGEFAKWSACRDRRLLECYDYPRALKESGAFGEVVSYSRRTPHEVPAAAAAGLISTFSYVRDYARGHGGEAYLLSLREKLEAFGETVRFVVPVIGAAGLAR